MAKNRGRYTLFLRKLSAHNFLVLPVNIKTSSTYPSPSSHVTLCFVSALRCKHSVVSSGIGVDGSNTSSLFDWGIC